MFASWAMLGFGALAGVPVLIHLIAKRRPRDVPFPAVMFLEGAEARLRGYFRPRDLLLLLLRASAILAAAVALAGPFVLKSSWGRRTPDMDLVCALDVSMSMEGKAVARARMEAERLLRGLGHGSRAGVFAFANRPLPPLPCLGTDVDEAVAYVRGLRARPFATDYVGALRACSDALRRSSREKAAVLFTDLTSAGLSRGRFEGIPPGVKLIVVDSSRAGRRNSWIESAGVRRTEVNPGEPVRLDVRLSLSSDSLVRVFLDGRAVEEEFAGKPGGEYSFYLRTFVRGFHEGRVTLSPGAGPVADDVRFFVFRVGRGAAVGVVDEGVYLRSAVAPEGSGAFSAEKLGPSDLNALALSRFDAVVVGRAELSGAAWEAVEMYVAAGGGLVVFAGAGGLDAGEYGRHAFSEQAPYKGLLPGSLAAEETGSFRLASFPHEALRGLDAGVAAGVEILSRAALRAAPGDSSAQVLAAFGDGAPAALGRRCGRGRVAAFAFGCGPEAGELVKRGEVFVPLVREAVRWVCGRAVAGRELHCGEAAVFDAEGECSALFPGREERIELRAYAGKLRLPPPREPGVVRLQTGGREAHLPCNPDARESDLAGLGADAFTRFCGGEVEVVGSGQDALKLLAREGRLRLGWLAWLVAAAALVAEAALLRFYGRGRGGV